MDVHLSELGPGHILLDASGMLHAALSLCARDITKERWTSFDRNIAERLRVWTMASEGTISVLVFDGHRCEAKRANEDRKAVRDEANASIPALLEFANELRTEYALFGYDKEEEGEVDESGSASSSDDTGPCRSICVQRVTAAIKDLRKAEQKAVGRYATDAAYRVLRMCADRGIKTIVAALARLSIPWLPFMPFLGRGDRRSWT